MGEPESARFRGADRVAATDADLVAALRSGQAAALTTLYDRYAGLVYSLALRILGQPSEAEDLTQEIFVTFWQKQTYNPARGSLSSYLCMLTRSRAIDKLRSRQSGQRFLDRWQQTMTGEWSGALPFEQVASQERRERVQQAMAEIPLAQRQILELLYFAGLSQSEVAQQLDIPLGTVKTRSRQGLIKLRQLLKNLVG
ncbi:MAG: sigma-70 family RNA polymerase sigma factor [Cyanobacteriota bacterium]|nr:sigma-70 family RNA polymerase sigma factor [Cyanobacteriota bacterium]